MERSTALSALMALLLIVAAAATPTPAAHCPEDCSCSLSQYTHKPLYHLKCNSTKGLLLAEGPIHSSIPMHSIDLSYLGLTRFGHVLDKLPDLTSVDLSHNELHELGHLSKRIKKLNLKHNRLTSAKLVKLPLNLQILNLQHNGITNLPIEITHLQHLQQLEIGHNDINCSCKTLEVRNWLQERHVYMEHPVVCSHPVEVKGKSWLQLKQSDICQKEGRGWFTPEADENELMMGDQPAAASGEHEEEEEEELGKDFLPFDGKTKTQSKPKKVARSPQEPLPGDEVEGSGDLSETNMELSLPEEAAVEVPLSDTTAAPIVEHIVNDEEEEDNEGSGSGGGILIMPAIANIPIGSDDDQEEGHPDDNDNDIDNQPIETPVTPDIFKNSGIGIFEGSEGEQEPVQEGVIVPVVQTKLDTETRHQEVVTDGPIDDSTKSADIQTAQVKDDSNAIYYLLAVIGLVVVGLILFVAIKRCKYDSNVAARDAEAQRQTELLDMDKKNLGKPLTKNGHGLEHSPLIGEKTKLDEAQIVKKPYDNGDAKDGANQQPLLNGNGSANGAAKEVPSINEPAPHEYYPITPRYPTPQSPRASKYAQHPQGGSGTGSPDEQNNNEPDSTFLPSSPKSGRYSPVYSPETGRVKIKLTETPKPKTPMLVTRSKSNAGDIISTPVRPVVPTHQVQLTVNGNGVGH
ncbi:protein windpipe [Drosophila miranda]|uniref:protein windpipe n=1 Tax=Drosophila miranda TaxID=7229 RepID=UPI0007E6E221|nr:protein windpipe [Drosophila miranda]XP_017150056.1 protein windpipe [Drosophila miranda]XP_033247315.1 protein windpipe [Drosophila miranda]